MAARAAGRPCDRAAGLDGTAAATIHDLIAGGAGPFPGAPLRALWEEPSADSIDTPVLAEGNPDRGRKSVLLGSYHFIRRYETEIQEEELYDLRTDPEAQTNLVDDQRFDGVADRMRALLDSALGSAMRPSPVTGAPADTADSRD